MRIAIGGVLLVAAGLKLYGREVSPYAQYGWLHTPWVQTLTVAWELLLGAWLVSGEYRVAGRAAALVTFVAFAGVSGYLGWVGQASCGCFGSVKTSPWWVFGFDVTAILALVATRPATGNFGAVPLLWLNWRDLRAVGVGLVCVGVLAGLGCLAFGSLGKAFAVLRGDTLGVSASVLDFGTGSPGDVLEASLQVVNYSDRPVRLVGGTSDCSCIATQDLPVTLNPGESSMVRVVLRVPPGDAGLLNRRIEFMTDCADQPLVKLRGVCLVKP